LALLELKDYKKAIADYNKAIQLQPENATYYKNRGNARNGLGNIKGAEEDWKQAKKMNDEKDAA
jgi:tetratricopeptide (TPR) repeat protein